MLTQRKSRRKLCICLDGLMSWSGSLGPLSSGLLVQRGAGPLVLWLSGTMVFCSRPPGLERLFVLTHTHGGRWSEAACFTEFGRIRCVLVANCAVLTIILLVLGCFFIFSQSTHSTSTILHSPPLFFSFLLGSLNVYCQGLSPLFYLFIIIFLALAAWRMHFPFCLMPYPLSLSCFLCNLLLSVCVTAVSSRYKTSCILIQTSL